MNLYPAPPPPPAEPVTRIGGRPLLPAEIEWPTCAQCQAAMQFLAQVPHDYQDEPGLFSIFMCDNGGDCETWDSQAGANRALWASIAGSVPRDPPEANQDLLLPEQGVCDTPVAPGGESEPVYLLGNTDEPEWVQSEEYPACQCQEEDDDPEQRAMVFVVQLEESIGANFGDCGSGYGFHCAACGDAKFLWQCC